MKEKQERLLVASLGLFIVFEYLRRYPPPGLSVYVTLPHVDKVASAALTLLLLLSLACAFVAGCFEATLHEGQLHQAVRDADAEQVRVLLGQGADADAAGFRQATPLIIAAELGHSEIVGLLAVHGADAERRDIGRAHV